MPDRYAVCRSVGHNIDAFAVKTDLINQARSPDRHYIMGAQSALSAWLSAAATAGHETTKSTPMNYDQNAQVDDHLDEHQLTNREAPQAYCCGLAKPLIRPTILVEANHTLQNIAERYLADANLAWLIADLNRNNIKESFVDGKRIVQLRTRQKLTIPIWPDIVEFYSQWPSVDRPDLITIVEEWQIDRELISTVLGPVTSSHLIQNETKTSPGQCSATAAEQEPENDSGCGIT